MSKCKEYHNWEVVGVSGTLPYQEVELKCSRCEATHNANFDYDD